MKTVISSFSNIADPDSDRTRSIFYRMPPSSCLRWIVDAESYDRLRIEPHPRHLPWDS